MEDALKLQFLEGSLPLLFHVWVSSLPGYTGTVCEVKSVAMLAKFNLKCFEMLVVPFFVVVFSAELL